MDRSKEARTARKLARGRKASATGSNYKARKSRERFNTWIIIALVALVGAALVVWAVVEDRAEEARATESPSASPTSTPTPESTEVVPDDPSIPAGEPKAFTEPAKVADTPIACSATQPDNAAAVRNTYPGGPAEVLGDTDWVAEIQTSCGPVVIDLLEKEAPKTVNSFVFLSQQKFFDGLEIFRNATTIGALQTGSGTNDATWKIGYSLPDELRVAEQGYVPGDVAMANAGPNTGGSQFFFVYNDKFQLPPSYATFGRVISGMDVVELIGSVPAAGDSGETPQERVYMNNVVVREATPEEHAAGEAKAQEAAANAAQQAPAAGAATPEQVQLPAENAEASE
ncbi:peptidylprolyl isomerase [Stomatohabitans albus]|uniref:peptidylprolyl isomerase n=1 Tax=Stomatohabitans albus TaxID=3110766 RepID=UPI00300C3F40